MKRKIVTIILLVSLAAAAVLVVIFAPRKIVGPADDIQFSTVTYRGNSMVVDDLKLKAILSRYDAQRTMKQYFPYQHDRIEIEIDLARNNRPVHILLGELNIWYESADRGSYAIRHAQELKREILDLIMY